MLGELRKVWCVVEGRYERVEIWREDGDWLIALLECWYAICICSGLIWQYGNMAMWQNCVLAHACILF